MRLEKKYFLLQFRACLKMRKLRNYTIIILFGLSCLIYLFYRDNIILHNWIGETIFHNFRNSEIKEVITITLPYWIIYNLPDAIWTMTLMYILLYIWNFRITKRNILWIVSPILIACSIEFGQKYNIINGTYDAKDLIFIIIGSLIPLIDTLKIKYYEKTIY